MKRTSRERGRCSRFVALGRLGVLAVGWCVQFAAHAQPAATTATNPPAAPTTTSATPTAPNPSATPTTTSAPPDPIWSAISLRLEVDPEVSSCASQSEVSDWVNELVGRRFVEEGAPVELLVRVRQAQVEGLSVELLVREASPSGAESVLRNFEQTLPCAELLRAAALTISLFARNSESAQTAEPSALASGEVPRAPLDPEGASSSSVPPTDGQGLTPGVATELPPVSAAPQPAERAAPRPEATERRDVPQPPRSSEQGYKNLQWLAGLGGLGALGVNPGVGAGATAHVGVHLSQWDMILQGGYVMSSGRRLTTEGSGLVYASNSELSLSACPVFQGQVALRVCGSVGALWVYGEGRGFDRDRRDLSTTLSVSGSAELLFRLGSQWALGTRAQLLVPLEPVRFQLADTPASAWTMWPLAPRASVGIEWR